LKIIREVLEADMMNVLTSDFRVKRW
jgi:hypothetical protein